MPLTPQGRNVLLVGAAFAALGAAVYLQRLPADPSPTVPRRVAPEPGSPSTRPPATGEPTDDEPRARSRFPRLPERYRGRNPYDLASDRDLLEVFEPFTVPGYIHTDDGKTWRRQTVAAPIAYWVLELHGCRSDDCLLGVATSRMNDRPTWPPPETREDYQAAAELLQLYRAMAGIWREAGRPRNMSDAPPPPPPLPRRSDAERDAGWGDVYSRGAARPDPCVVGPVYDCLNPRRPLAR